MWVPQIGSTPAAQRPLRRRIRVGDPVRGTHTRRERLPELVERLVAARGDQIRAAPAPVSPAVRDGALPPGPDAELAGVRARPDFDGWLAERVR